jgi:peptidoglycan/LPS O-acetylase OafA/YrhL
MKHTPHLDGLRAFAVLLVVGYHAFPAVVPGGYIGVDVFFVISGYLITGIIARGLEDRDFSIAAFYARRVRRIFPALIVVLAACSAAAWLILLPDELRQFGEEVAATAGFVANVELWSQSGYFDTAAELKPLLHMWSLGVEEQFYIAFPLLMLIARRIKLPVLWLVVTAGAASLVACLVLTSTYPDASFFLPHTRIWEILAGGALALRPAWTLAPARRDDFVCDFLAWLGVGLIAGAGLLLQQGILYPGGWALLPVGGSVLLIAAGEEAWFNRTILSWRPLVMIGIVSYPLYLWHWPLLSFARILYLGEPEPVVKLGLVALSLLLAMLTYLLVERPIRLRAPTLARVGVLAVLLLSVGLVGDRAMALDGLPSRFKDNSLDGAASLSSGRIAADLVTNACSVPETLRSLGGYWCQSDNRGPPSFALIGDSHAIQLFQPLVHASAPGQRWELISRPGCTFALNIARKDGDGCNQLSAPVIDAVVRDARIDVVLFAFWHLHAQAVDYASLKPEPPGTTNNDRLVDGLSATFDRLEAAGKAVVLLVDNPQIALDVKDCVVERPFRLKAPVCSITRSEHETAMAPFRRLVQALRARHPKLIVYDPTDIYCSDRCEVAHQGKSLYMDVHHLSDYGASLVVPGLTKFMIAARDSVAEQRRVGQSARRSHGLGS